MAGDEAAVPSEIRRATMRDVAARARVSLKTVSRVVNGEAGVSPALADRVRHAVDELGFRPNVGARHLRRAGQRTASIALLLDDVSNPFCAAVLRAVEDVATPRGVLVFAASIEEDPGREQALAREFVDRRVDGILLFPAGDDQSYLEAELRAGTAVVCVDREPCNLPADSVVTTNALGAAVAVRHLASAGHRRIAFLGDNPRIATATQRLDGYRSAHDELGLPVGPVVLHVGDAASADGAVTALLARSDPPTALFTGRNLITVGALRALARLGRRHTTALVGFDDFPLADLLVPGVTVIRQDGAAIGQAAAELLFARIDGHAGPTTVRLVPTELVRRGSGEIGPPR